MAPLTECPVPAGTGQALNRLTAIDYPGSALDVTYSYDQGTFGARRLTTMEDAPGSIGYAYDGHGNLIQETLVPATSSWSLPTLALPVGIAGLAFLRRRRGGLTKASAGARERVWYAVADHRAGASGAQAMGELR